jgi:hypothetical protein
LEEVSHFFMRLKNPARLSSRKKFCGTPVHRHLGFIKLGAVSRKAEKNSLAACVHLIVVVDNFEFSSSVSINR